jgi:hypothetical protein
MNNYFHYLNSERQKHKELHDIFSSQFKFKDANAKFTVGPLLATPTVPTENENMN